MSILVASLINFHPRALFENFNLFKKFIVIQVLRIWWTYFSLKNRIIAFLNNLISI